MAWNDSNPSLPPPISMGQASSLQGPIAEPSLNLPPVQASSFTSLVSQRLGLGGSEAQIQQNEKQGQNPQPPNAYSMTPVSMRTHPRSIHSGIHSGIPGIGSLYTPAKQSAPPQTKTSQKVK